MYPEVYPEPTSALERAASWLLEVLSWLFSPIPGSKVHDEAFCRAVKQRNDELEKPAGQRDEAVLSELTEHMLRLQLERCQVLQRGLRDSHQMFLQPPKCECCSDCRRVRQRLAASFQSMAAWYECWEHITSQQLQAVRRGEPPPAMPFPHFELRLPPDVPEQLPPSVDRCFRCQHNLDYYLHKEEQWRAEEAAHGDEPVGV